MPLLRRTFLTGAAAALASPARSAAPDDGRIKFRELYARDGEFSELALDAAGEELSVEGFMAPPLKVDARFFVLTKLPMSVCPFCEDESDWPENIVVVYVRDSLDPVPFNWPIVTTGRLEIGPQVDEETGFWSAVRLMDAAFERL